MEIINFKKDHFQIRMVEKDNEELFFAIDVAKSLGYRNTDDAIRRHVFKEYITTPVKHGGPILLSEPGRYQLICRSKRKEAIAFQKWVFEEVLPSIRKTGKYEVKSNVEKIRDVGENVTREDADCKQIKLLFIEYNNKLKDPKKVSSGKKGGEKTQENNRKNVAKLGKLEEKINEMIDIL